MIDSGYEPEYNTSGKGGNTSSQWNWLKANWKPLNPRDTGDLQPGDVAVNAAHTYIYVGEVDGFDTKIASASYSENGNGRAPMAGKEMPADPSFSWYRKK